GHIYAYSNELGHYKQEGETLLKADIVQAFGPLANRTRVGEILAKVQALSYTDEETLNNSVPPRYIPLEDFVFDLDTGTLYDQSPHFFFTYKHPVRYNPQATCPTIQQFLTEIVATEHDKQILFDIIALCLYRARITRRFFVLSGGGHNGKSLFLTIL